MKRLLLFLSFFAVVAPNFAARVVDSIYSADIGTVSLSRNDVVLAAPVLNLNSQDFLMLRFDRLGEQPGFYRYRILHCNAEWQCDSLEPVNFISGFEEAPIENYQFSLNTLQPYVNYYQRIPSQYSNFIASGNYLLEVFLQDAPDSVVLTRRFYVTENLLSVGIEVNKPYNGERIRQCQEVDVMLGASSANSNLLIPQYLKVFVQQNGRIDNRRLLPFSGYASGSLAYRWSPENIFPGGNCFRYFDISNIRTPMYQVQRIERYDFFQPEGRRESPWFAFLRPEFDLSDKNFSYNQTLNGGMKVNVWDRNDAQTESDYVWVNFTLPMERPFLNGSIYVVGDLTQWLLDEESRMEWNPRQKAYTKRLFLKQGYYAYQLLFLPIGETEGQTATLEGDHFETPNNYSVFVYYRYPGDLFDRLISIESR